MTKEQTYQAYYKKKKVATLKRLEKYPTLHWAKKWHRNTRNEEMAFSKMPYLLALYKGIHEWQNFVMEKSVQCGASELFIVSAHEESHRGLTVFYVLPKYESRNRFVNNRIHRLHKRVGMYANWVRQAKQEGGSHRTALMHFGQGTMAFVGSNVEEEFLEIPVDSGYIDEKDRCNMQNLLLLPDRLTASPYKLRKEASTPTIEEFGIDERYLESTQGRWMIQCEACLQWFEPTWFETIVEEVGVDQYIVRDKEYVPFEKDPRVMCPKCRSPVDRLKKGEWVHKFANREWVGVRVNKIFSKHTSLDALVREWLEIGSHELKKQVFFNSNLGLPYSSKGAKIHKWQLDNCKRRYQWPYPSHPLKAVRLMGVDVGTVLHGIVRDRVIENGVPVRRLIDVFEVATFKHLERKIKEWQPKVCVIDAQPEIHEVASLKAKYKNVWSSRFQEQRLELTKDKKNKIVTMNRTSILDFVKRGIDEEFLILPAFGEQLGNNLYYAHMSSSTRILEADEVHPERNRFVWKHVQPDHYFLAEAYCMQADFLLPDSTLFQFFQEETIKVQGFKSALTPETIVEDISRMKPSGTVAKLKETEKQKVGQLLSVERQAFLQQKNKTYTSGRAMLPLEEVAREQLIDAANDLCKKQDKFSLVDFANVSGLRGERGRSFLIACGFVEVAEDTFTVRQQDGEE